MADYAVQREGSDRRGNRLRNWMQVYWMRYYKENPEKDRRQGRDRRQQSYRKRARAFA